MQALIHGLMRARDDGWSLELSQPSGANRGMWGKTFVRFQRADAQSA